MFFAPAPSKQQEVRTSLSKAGSMQMKLKPIVTRTIRICRGVTTLPPFALPLLRSDRNSHFGVSPDSVAFRKRLARNP